MTTPLFDEPKTVGVWEFLDQLARKLAKADNSWHLGKVERIANGTLCTLRRQTRVIKNGKHKGKAEFGESQLVVVTQADQDAAEAEYVQTTGNCSTCFGKGTCMRAPCKKCDGTGRAIIKETSSV